MTSRDWYLYFTENLKEQRINWGLTPILDRKKDRKLVRSLQAWQKGETSDGRHLLRAAGKYAKKRQDPDYLSAITLFIQEEQKHGENLGKYLDKIGADRIRFDLGDWLFRRVRYFNTSMELWTVTVIAVENFAQMYYARLAKAANCPLLSNICHDILTDEAPHLRFQAERLQAILAERRPETRTFTFVFYRLLFATITVAVWVGHGHVFRKGGLGFSPFWKIAGRRFTRLLTELGTLDATDERPFNRAAPAKS